MLYSAIKSYKATKDDEITASIGTVVEVLQKSDNGWWFVRYLSNLQLWLGIFTKGLFSVD